MNKTMRAVGAAVFLAVGWFGNEVLGPKDKPPQMMEVADPTVAVGTAQKVAFNPTIEYVGHVEPIQETEILPQVDGYIKKVCFQEGAFVRAGEVLFEIDTEQYEASRRLRVSEVRSAEAKVRVAESEVDRAERYYKRLASADDRGITATEVDTAETALASAKAELNAARAAVEQAKAAEAIAEFNMKHTVVKSPIAGRIGKALHHVGDYVSPSKSPLAEVVQIDPIRVVFPITDKEYGQWRTVAEHSGTRMEDSRRLRLKLPDGRMYDKIGTLDFGDNRIDASTATVNLRVRYENAAGDLLPNAFVRIVSDESHPPQLLTVPAGAIELSATGAFVWVLGADQTVKVAPVTVGATWNGLTVVEKGLEEGARVVSLGGFKLKDGQKVRLAP